ncbi:MAG: hypothetical protein QW112_03920 [Candidatus Micrarchaeia archaeon]
MELSAEIIKTLSESGLDKQTVENMLSHYAKMRWEYVMADHEAVGMHAGKFCEHAANLVLKILTGQLKERPRLDVVLSLIDKAQGNASVDEMIRVTMPRMLRAVYELRNKRGAVHANLALKVNKIDAHVALNICSWVLAELVRIYYTGEMEASWKLIDKISRIDLPFIDEYRGRKLIMSLKLSVAEEILLHLTNVGVEIPVDALVTWIPGVDRNHVLTSLRQLRDKRMVWYEGEATKITPLGAIEAERIVKKIEAP